MNRDGRGNPGRIVLKNNQPNLRLADVLRRRRTNLSALVAELGITTYASLCIWCKRMGVSAPDQKEFDIIFPPDVHINSPQEGVVVLDAPNLPEIDAKNSAFDVSESMDNTTLRQDTEPPMVDDLKKPRKKKMSPTV